MKECEKSVRLSAYMDGEMSLEEAAALRGHLAECASCAAALQELQGLGVFMRGVGRSALSAEGWARLHGRVDAWRGRGAERLAGVLTALAACLAVASALSLMQAGETAPAPAPLPWETTAGRSADDGSTNSKETAVAEWMVADLSHGSANGE